MRWTTRRKAAVLEAVRSGRLTIEEACRTYNISVDELAAWQRDMGRYGIPGLRSTRFQIYRDTDKQRRG
jgi:transposase-like protein